VTERLPDGLFDAVLHKPLDRGKLIKVLARYLPRATDAEPAPAGDAHERRVLALLVSGPGASLWQAARGGNRPRDIREFADWLVAQEPVAPLAGPLGRDLQSAARAYQTDRLRALLSRIQEFLENTEDQP